MNTLREISKDYQDILNEAINNEEIPEEMMEKLKRLDVQFDEKIENMAYIVQELQTKCNMVNIEIDRLNERIVKWRKNLKAIKEYMLGEMISVGKNKIDTDFYTVRVRKSEICEIDNDFINEAKEKSLEKLLRIVPERIEPDKMAIKEYINSGKTLNHARILEKQNLNIK